MPPKRMPKDVALAAFEELERPRAANQVEPFMKAVTAMSQYREDYSVSRKGCFAMAYGSFSSSRQVFEAGGLQAILNAMRRHPMDERLQAEGLEALRVLAEQPDGAEEVLAAGGLQAAITSMGILPEAQWVQQEACGFLCALTTCADGRKQLLRSGALEAVLRVMEGFPRATWVQMWGCLVIKRLAEVDPRGVDACGGFEAADRARSSKTNLKAEAVQLAATEALRLRPHS